jgi:uncharacterized membrane protein YqjE
MDETPHEPGGLWATGKRILRTLCSLAETRVELFLVELQEERIRLLDALLLAGACLVCAFMALALLTLTVVVIFWEQHRILVLVLLTLAYAAAAGWSFYKLRNRLQEWQSFAATLEQFKKDQACLEKQD